MARPFRTERAAPNLIRSVDSADRRRNEMRTKNVALAGLCSLALFATSVGGAQAQEFGSQRPMRYSIERHPEIMRAMRALQRTRADLAAANRDFGGHRTRAVQLVDQAIDELKAALAYDRH